MFFLLIGFLLFSGCQRLQEAQAHQNMLGNGELDVSQQPIIEPTPLFSEESERDDSNERHLVTLMNITEDASYVRWRPFWTYTALLIGVAIGVTATECTLKNQEALRWCLLVGEGLLGYFATSKAIDPSKAVFSSLWERLKDGYEDCLINMRSNVNAPKKIRSRTPSLETIFADSVTHTLNKPSLTLLPPIMPLYTEDSITPAPREIIYEE